MSEQCPAPARDPNIFDIHLRCNAAKGQVQIMGPLEMKAAMIMALTTAIQIVVDHGVSTQSQNGNGNGKTHDPTRADNHE